MSIREVLQKQIADLEAKIANQQGDVAVLKDALAKLQMQDFEEDLRESGNQQLLNG
jgi:hypothetical protein